MALPTFNVVQVISANPVIPIPVNKAFRVRHQSKLVKAIKLTPAKTVVVHDTASKDCLATRAQKTLLSQDVSQVERHSASY